MNPKKSKNRSYHTNDKYHIGDILERRMNLVTREVTTEIKVQESVIEVSTPQIISIIREHFESQESFKASGFKIEKIELDDVEDGVRVVFIKPDKASDALKLKGSRTSKDFDDEDDNDDGE